MFSGLIKQTGTLEYQGGHHIRVSTPYFKVKMGDSIAINGVCLTVTAQRKKGRSVEWGFDISDETLEKTTIRGWMRGQRLNIEPALKLSDSLGGHIVQGHVDGVGRLTKITDKHSSREMWIETSKDILNAIVPKGSITVDGVSLTAVKVRKTGFSVSLIPFTWKHTNLGNMKIGQTVNLEGDIIGKYVERYLKSK